MKFPWSKTKIEDLPEASVKSVMDSVNAAFAEIGPPPGWDSEEDATIFSPEATDVELDLYLALSRFLQRDRVPDYLYKAAVAWQCEKEF